MNIRYHKHDPPKTNTIKMLEYMTGKSIYDLLYEEYFVNGLSIRGIAKKYCIAMKTVWRYINIYEIPRKPIKLKEENGGNEHERTD